MKKFSINEIDAFLDKSNLCQGDTLFVHNSFLKFGIPSDIPIATLAEVFYSRIKNKIGDSGTIAVPTFNFDFCNDIPFNRQKSPSQGMGVFSEYVRTLTDSKRSLHPMQSLSVIGKNSDYIIENDTDSTFNPEGPFDRLIELNAKIILLGADFNTVSMIHWVEEKYLVPYRYWKTFSGTIIDDGKESNQDYKMYVRSRETNPQLKMYSVEKTLIKEGKIDQYTIGGGSVKVFNVRDFISIAEKSIKNNPYFFVSNHPKFELYEN